MAPPNSSSTRERNSTLSQQIVQLVDNNYKNDRFFDIKRNGLLLEQPFSQLVNEYLSFKINILFHGMQGGFQGINDLLEGLEGENVIAFYPGNDRKGKLWRRIRLVALDLFGLLEAMYKVAAPLQRENAVSISGLKENDFVKVLNNEESRDTFIKILATLEMFFEHVMRTVDRRANTNFDREDRSFVSRIASANAHLNIIKGLAGKCLFSIGVISEINEIDAFVLKIKNTLHMTANEKPSEKKRKDSISGNTGSAPAPEPGNDSIYTGQNDTDTTEASTSSTAHTTNRAYETLDDILQKLEDWNNDHDVEQSLITMKKAISAKLNQASRDSTYRRSSQKAQLRADIRTAILALTFKICQTDSQLNTQNYQAWLRVFSLWEGNSMLQGHRGRFHCSRNYTFAIGDKVYPHNGNVLFNRPHTQQAFWACKQALASEHNQYILNSSSM